MGLLNAPQVGDDAGIRKLLQRVESVEAKLREMSAALGGVEGLTQAQDDLGVQQEQIAAQVAFLAGQTTTAVVTHNSSASGSSVSAAVVAFASSDDAAITFTPGSTGLVSVAAGGIVEATTYQAWARAGFGIQIVDSLGAQVFQPDFQGFYVLAPYVSAGGNAVGAQITIPLTPGATYTARARRMWAIDDTGAGPTLTATWRRSLISVTKMGL